jgi:hypothetical protein
MMILRYDFHPRANVTGARENASRSMYDGQHQKQLMLNREARTKQLRMNSRMRIAGPHVLPAR